jgi:adenylylsulfate kinase-like enzyme
VDGRSAGLSSAPDLEFGADRPDGLRQVGALASLLNDSGLIAICTFVAPVAAERQWIRERVGAERFVEVYLSAPMGICRRRDPGGLYAKADAGQIQHFPGVSVAYEPPGSPDLVLPTHEISVADGVDRVMAYLSKCGYIP